MASDEREVLWTSSEQGGCVVEVVSTVEGGTFWRWRVPGRDDVMEGPEYPWQRSALRELVDECRRRDAAFPCSCSEEADNQIRHGRAPSWCTCADHPPEERCDCAWCLYAAERSRLERERDALAEALLASAGASLDVCSLVVSDRDPEELSAAVISLAAATDAAYALLARLGAE